MKAKKPVAHILVLLAPAWEERRAAGTRGRAAAGLDWAVDGAEEAAGDCVVFVCGVRRGKGLGSGCLGA